MQNTLGALNLSLFLHCLLNKNFISILLILVHNSGAFNYEQKATKDSEKQRIPSASSKLYQNVHSHGIIPLSEILRRH